MRKRVGESGSKSMGESVGMSVDERSAKSMGKSVGYSRGESVWEIRTRAGVSAGESVK